MNTDDVVVFLATVNAGSLAEAARRLGLQPMVATRRLAALETMLGVRLLHRTTRSLSLTPEGETFLPFARAMIENETEAKALLRAESRGAAGLLRVSVPVAFGLRYVTPFVPQLLEQNPELRIALDLTDHLPDLVASGTDLAIRIARLRDSSLIAQKLSDNPRCIVASPDYLARRGIPHATDEIAEHDCLPLGSATHWTFSTPEGEKHIRLNARFSANTMEGCYATCLAGGGLALLSTWYVSDDVKTGRLVRLNFGEARPETLNIWAVYPTTRLVLPKVRVFIAALREAITASAENFHA